MLSASFPLSSLQLLTPRIKHQRCIGRRELFPKDIGRQKPTTLMMNIFASCPSLNSCCVNIIILIQRSVEISQLLPHVEKTNIVFHPIAISFNTTEKVYPIKTLVCVCVFSSMGLCLRRLMVVA